MKDFKVSKAVIAMILSLSIIFSGISAMAVPVGASTKAGTGYDKFDTNKTYYIWLKDEADGTSAPITDVRRSIFRWNINGSGDGKNAVVHLDYQYGENCTMKFESVGDGYYGIRYTGSDYWIDTEGDNQNTNEVLHQNSKDLKDTKYNQHFQFIPVSDEKDTYYIYCRKANLYVGVRDNDIKREAKLVTADESNRKKWVITSEDHMLTGKEVKLYESSSAKYPQDGAPVFTLNPENYQRDVNVSADADGPNDDLHLFYIGTSSKISAEWVDSKKAYRLRSLTLEEDQLKAQDLVWDVAGQSAEKDAKVHLWINEGDTHASQLWRFIPVEGKSNVYYIYNVNSCLYLSIDGGYNKSGNDKNEVKLVQSKTAFPWELHILNKNGLTAYKSGATGEEINSGNWMSMLPDTMYLSELNIPGTHDAGATNMLTNLINQLSPTICHQLYLDEQLNAGIRAWDIRIDKKSAQSEEDPNIVHGESAFICRNRDDGILELDEVMKTAKAFLDTHPQETIVITLKGDGKSITNLLGDDDDIAKHVVKYIKDTSYPIYRPTSDESGKIPTLGQIRGKIVFIRRLSLSNSCIHDLNVQSKSLTYSLLDAFGPDASLWDQNEYSKYMHAQQVGDSNVYVQDNYGEGNADKKYTYFTGTIDDATQKKLTADGSAYLFNYSAAKDDMDQPEAINQKLMKEERLNQPTSLDSKKTIGMVMTNYIDAKLSTRIYMTNFVAEHTHKYSDNGFCTICDQYEPAARNSSGIYEIGNGGQLFWFASLVNGDRRFADFDAQNAGAKAVLVKDVNLESREWLPIRDYTGNFDGQDHTISNLRITQTSSDTGLFRSVYGTIENFTVKGNITLSYDGDYIGGAVGYADDATIRNIASYVNISNTSGTLRHVGGVVGYIANEDTYVEKCVYNGTMDIKDSHDCIGGIVGYTNGGARISNCANNGTVSASKEDAYVGGILGYVNNTKPTVKDCYNYGTVKNGASQKYCGAIIGWARNYTSDHISNNYYLDSASALAFGSGSKSGATAAAKTAYAFHSGEVAYLLNHKATDGTQIWHQNLDNDKMPNLHPIFANNGKDTVYALLNNKGYSNYPQTAKESVLTRVDLRTYHRVIGKDGSISSTPQITTGFGLVDNKNKIITLYCLEKTERVGIFPNQGVNGSAGIMTLEGYDEFKFDDKTSADMIAEGNEPTIYVDANKCIFIKFPEDGSDVKDIKVNYTQKPTSEYTTTQYTLNVVTVSSEHFNTVGATQVTLSKNDPDYGLTAGSAATKPATDNPGAVKPGNTEQTNHQQSDDGKGSSKEENAQNNQDIQPVKTGDDYTIAFWIGLMLISFASIIILGRRRLKKNN